MMKLILAIVSNDDSAQVSSTLTRNGYQVTKLATTGGFLMAGNTTLLIGVDEDKLDTAIDLIRKHSKRRTQMMPSNSAFDNGMYTASFPMDVSVGGATIFVLNVERFEKA